MDGIGTRSFNCNDEDEKSVDQTVLHHKKARQYRQKKTRHRTEHEKKYILSSSVDTFYCDEAKDPPWNVKEVVFCKGIIINKKKHKLC